jgi:SAM-dependent methyltransferase
MIAETATRLIRLLPPTVRERLKARLGGLGHGPGLAQALRGMRDSRGRKRLDRVAPDVARLLLQANTDVVGRKAMSFGAGHLADEALALFLAGAEEVLAVDYFPIVGWTHAERAFRLAPPEALVNALLPVAPAETIRARHAQLHNLHRWTTDSLGALGIIYRAPVDFAESVPFPDRLDWIMSRSVLEHLPPDRAGDILLNVFRCLRPGGIMSHGVHLEDHRDFAGAPHAFLAADTDWTPAQADTRGNRLRPSDWRRLARALPGGLTRLVEDWPPHPQHPLPPALAPEFAGRPAGDLAAPWIEIVTRRPALPRV